MATWLNLVDARKFWRDAPADDPTLTMYLAAAREEIEAYGAGLLTPAAPFVAQLGTGTVTFDRSAGVVTVTATAWTGAVPFAPQAIPAWAMPVTGAGLIAIPDTPPKLSVGLGSVVGSGLPYIVMAHVAASAAVFGAYAAANADDRVNSPESIPETWRMAQWQQARNTYNAGRAAAGAGSDDGSSFGLVTMPLDWKIQQLIRPRRALGAIA